jgi:hypothetical protein
VTFPKPCFDLLFDAADLTVSLRATAEWVVDSLTAPYGSEQRALADILAAAVPLDAALNALGLVVQDKTLVHGASGRILRATWEPVPMEELPPRPSARHDAKVVLLREVALAVHAARLPPCDGTYVDFQGASRPCAPSGEGCALRGCTAATGPHGGY